MSIRGEGAVFVCCYFFFYKEAVISGIRHIGRIELKRNKEETDMHDGNDYTSSNVSAPPCSGYYPTRCTQSSSSRSASTKEGSCLGIRHYV